MPGQDRAAERAYAGGGAIDVVRCPGCAGETTYEIYPNDDAYWRNLPTSVWIYRLGGFQVLKKWLSYRDRKVLGRALKVEEVGYFSEVSRRIAAITFLPAICSSDQ